MAPDDNTAPPAKPCPICGKPALQRFRPFCSARCADVDLGRWLKGSYVVPAEVTEEAPGRRDED
jgi:endogenous inhibitor of DNA gyrase (YacG/DUF329 family)